MKIELSSGMFSEPMPNSDPAMSANPNMIERDAMLVYCGKFQSMDGEVEITEEHLLKLSSNHNTMIARIGRLLTGELPLKACPPIQLDHSTSARDTVGRLVGSMSIRDHVLEDGSVQKALFGRIRILGAENVERIMDGRWTHLSIGADLDEGKISELTITPFPAAAEASLLSKGNKTMTLMERIKKMFKLSEDKEADDRMGKLKKHLMDEEQMSEKDADEKLSKMSDEDMAKMSNEIDEKMKRMELDKSAKEKMAEKPEETEEAKAKMAAKTAKIAQLSSDFRKTSEAVQLTKNKMKINTRLSGLKASGKITPAEVKKIDIMRLAKANEATLDAVFRSYEEREPVIVPGQLGSLKAISTYELGKEKKKADAVELERETKANMSFTAAAIKNTKKSRFSDESTEGAVGAPKNENMEQPAPQGEPKQMASFDQETYDALCRMMDEGRVEEVKKHLKDLMMAIGATEEPAGNAGGESEKEMSALADELKKMQNGFEELIGLVSDSAGSAKLEGEK